MALDSRRINEIHHLVRGEERSIRKVARRLIAAQRPAAAPAGVRRRPEQLARLP